VRPVSSLYFVSLRDFAANSFVNLIIAAGILAWSLARYPGDLGAGRIAVFLCLMLVGNFIFYFVHMWFLIPTFWLHSSQGLWQLFFQVEKFAERPHQIFTPWIRRIITSIIPFGVMVSFPAHALFEGLSAAMALNIALVCVFGFALTVFFWNLGLRSYASASS